MAPVVYAVCCITSLTCAVLLQRGWARSRVRLLLWAAACFWLLTVNNVVLILDRLVFKDTDLGVLQSASAALASLIFLGGLIWSER